ncbi:hypothetical protein [Sphingomonas glacialis]|uniref:hypothetical protein n=1 Tax=Sphingomonas glacialis TaxID=658225 RepID=UPI0027E3CBE9|nr:hypothetical protein [Sphingomonas glacialis]
MNRISFITAGLMAISGLSVGAGAQSYGRDDQRAEQDQQQGRDQRGYDRRDQGRYDQGNRDQGNGDGRWHGERDGNWDPSNSYQDGRYRERRLSTNDRVYRGSDGRYYCKRSNGTTGLVLGGVGGGLIGNVLGGGTLGTLLGAGGGALLGKTLDQNHDRQQNRDNGYRCR